eukprot:2194833-Prymnesium_polylepis.2
MSASRRRRWAEPRGHARRGGGTSLRCSRAPWHAYRVRLRAAPRGRDAAQDEGDLDLEAACFCPFCHRRAAFCPFRFADAPKS